MKCASCGAGLQITPDMDYFVCGYCGASLSVARQGGTVALKLVTDSIAKVQVGTDRTAAELALVRLPKEIKERRRELDAIEEQIRYLETEINMASLPSTGSRKASLIIQQALRAILLGSAFGWFIGFFLDLLIPTNVAVFVGLVLAVLLAGGDFIDPGRTWARSKASSDDLADKIRRRSAPHNAERLLELEQASSALKDRLQVLNRQTTAARAVVDS